jgi:alkylhydroperoxidase family enzyme
MLLHAPALAEGWVGLGTAIRYQSGLDARIRELATCLVARLTGSEYEWAHHAPLARQAGLTDAQLGALGDPDRAEVLVEYRDLLDTVASVVEDRRAPDELLERVRAQLGDSGTVELVGLAAYYVAVSRFLKALEVETEEGL